MKSWALSSDSEKKRLIVGTSDDDRSSSSPADSTIVRLLLGIVSVLGAELRPLIVAADADGNEEDEGPIDPFGLPDVVLLLAVAIDCCWGGTANCIRNKLD